MRSYLASLPWKQWLSGLAGTAIAVGLVVWFFSRASGNPVGLDVNAVRVTADSGSVTVSGQVHNEWGHNSPDLTAHVYLYRGSDYLAGESTYIGIISPGDSYTFSVSFSGVAASADELKAQIDLTWPGGRVFIR